MKHLLLAIPLLAFTALDWQPFVIDSHVSVQLPAQPTEVDMAKLAKLAPGKKLGHTRMWWLQAPEGTYQVMRSPIGSVMSASDADARNSFYQGVLTSVMRNEQGQVIAVTAFPTAGGTGMEYEYKGIHRGTGKRVLKIMRSLVVDSISYSLAFTPADKQDSLGLAGAAQRSKFYNSLVVKP